MEAGPHLPALFFDLKTSLETVNLCENIPNYIAVHYKENPEKFSNECEQINRLRENAINCSIDETSLNYLKRYFCQLKLLHNRFPMLPDTECSVRFSWDDAFQKDDNSFNDIRFEEACILYNIGAIYSKLGANETRKTHQSMKNACTYFRYGAACFEKLRDQYITYSGDFTPELLTCQVYILLAQAHEAVLEKSLVDQRPPSVNAHISMQISEYCQMALENLMKPGINSILSKKFREWRVCLTYKISYYLSLAYYCSGLISEENKKYGESVCYFENSVGHLKDGWKNAEKISTDKSMVYKDAHTFINDIFLGKYKSAKRDNDHVYYEKIPTLSSLPTIRGAIVAKPQSFDCNDPDVCGADIFQNLVPMDTHLILSEYSEEKAKILREIIQLVETKNRELETFMNCLQLDRIPLNNEYLRLPRELLDCCAAAMTRSNISKDLQSSVEQLNNQHNDITERLNNFEELLKIYVGMNNSIKTNNDFQDLENNLKILRQMTIEANKNNIELDQQIKVIIQHLNILNLPIEQIEKTLPIIIELDDEITKTKLARLELLNEKIQTMKTQRQTLIDNLRKKIQDDDITKLVLMKRDENHKNLFSEQMKKYDEILNIIKQNCSAQDNILQSLNEANAEIADIRTKMSTTLQNRYQLIQEYINSFKSSDDLLLKANEGIEFYKKQCIKLNTLNEHLMTLQSEHKQQEKDLPDRPRLKDYLAAMKPETWGSKINRSSVKTEENLYISPLRTNMNYVNNVNNNQEQLTNSPYSNSIGQTFNSHNNSYKIETPTPYYQSTQYSIPYQQPQYNVQPQMIYSPLNNQSFYTSQPQPTVYSSTINSQFIPSFQNPSINQYKNFSDSNHFIQQNLPNKFDPYRPQPVGAYDIPKVQPTTTIPQPPPPLMNPQDVYRPGGLLGLNQTQILPNNNNYDKSQLMSAAPGNLSISSAFVNLSLNPMSNH